MFDGNHYQFKQVEGCRFCYDKIKDRVIIELGAVVAIKDKFPVSEGHILIIPKNHSTEYFELSQQEKEDADKLISELREQIFNNDPTVTGFNIGVNCGESAGQTIFHTHIHLKPRRDGDTSNPRGGVRGVIPDKMGY